jgi:hypothetical protein
LVRVGQNTESGLGASIEGEIGIVSLTSSTSSPEQLRRRRAISVATWRVNGDHRVWFFPFASHLQPRLHLRQNPMKGLRHSYIIVFGPLSSELKIASPTSGYRGVRRGRISRETEPIRLLGLRPFLCGDENAKSTSK